MDEIESLIIRYRLVCQKLADLRRGHNQGRNTARSLCELENEYMDLVWRIYNEVASQAVKVCRTFSCEVSPSLLAAAKELFDKSSKLLTQTLDTVSCGDGGPEDVGALVPYDLGGCCELYRRLKEIGQIAREALCLAENLIQVQGPASPSDPQPCQCQRDHSEELQHYFASSADARGLEPPEDLPTPPNVTETEPQPEPGQDPGQTSEPRQTPQQQIDSPSDPVISDPVIEPFPSDGQPQDERPRHEDEHEPPEEVRSSPDDQLSLLDTAQEPLEGEQGRPEPVIQHAEEAASGEALAHKTLRAPEPLQPEPAPGLHPDPNRRLADAPHAPEPVPAPVNPDAVVRRTAEFAKDPQTFPECWFFIEFLTQRHPGLEGLATLPIRELLELGYSALRLSGVEMGIEEFSASIRKNLDEVYSRYHGLTLPQRLMALAVSAPMVPFYGLGADLVKQVAFDPDIPSSLKRWALTVSMFWSACKRPFERPGLDPKALREKARREAADALKRVFESAKGMTFRFYLGNAVKNRLFPDHGRGELAWILDDVAGAQVREPSRRIKEWHRDFSPGDYLDRVSRDAMGPLKAKDIEGGARKRLLGTLTEIHQVVGEWIRTFEDPNGQGSRDTAAPEDPFQAECRKLCREFSLLAPECRRELERLSDCEFGVAKAWLERVLTVFAGRLEGEEEACRL